MFSLKLFWRFGIIEFKVLFKKRNFKILVKFGFILTVVVFALDLHVWHGFVARLNILLKIQ